MTTTTQQIAELAASRKSVYAELLEQIVSGIDVDPGAILDAALAAGEDANTLQKRIEILEQEKEHSQAIDAATVDPAKAKKERLVSNDQLVAAKAALDDAHEAHTKELERHRRVQSLQNSARTAQKNALNAASQFQSRHFVAGEVGPLTIKSSVL